MDQPALPARLRDLLTDALTRADEVFGPFDGLVPLVADALARSGQRTLVDLCSGAGGPARSLGAALLAEGHVDEVVLTDLFPNLAAMARPGAGFRAVTTPVDATAVPEHLAGLRTVFNAFHHLPPTVARAVLADAADKGQPILVGEVLSRTPGGMVVALGVAALAPLLALGARPFRLDRLLLNLVLPVVPLALVWEGAVSSLRCYSDDELRALTEGLGGPGYTWRVGHHKVWPALVRVNWLLGAPAVSPPPAA